jgi:hypothetical protein
MMWGGTVGDKIFETFYMKKRLYYSYVESHGRKRLKLVRVEGHSCPLMCPFCVLCKSGKCLRIRVVVRPAHVV